MEKDNKMNILEIKYEIKKDFLLSSIEHQNQFEEIKFVKTDMDTSYGAFDKTIIGKTLWSYLDDYFKKYNMKIKTVWAQKYTDGFHSAHIHYPNVQCFVWYVLADENCSKIRFYNPGWPYIETHEINIQPLTGTLLMFDSSIPHEVLYNSDKKRYVISGNLTWLK